MDLCYKCVTARTDESDGLCIACRRAVIRDDAFEVQRALGQFMLTYKSITQAGDTSGSMFAATVLRDAILSIETKHRVSMTQIRHGVAA